MLFGNIAKRSWSVVLMCNPKTLMSSKQHLLWRRKEATGSPIPWKAESKQETSLLYPRSGPPHKTGPWVPTPALSRALAGTYGVPQSKFAKCSHQQSRQITLQSSNTATRVSAHFFFSCKCAKESAVNVSYMKSLQAKDLVVNSLLKFPTGYIHKHTCA